MLAKLTSKNQLTLPKAIIDEIGPAVYFEVQTRNGQILLTPVRIQRGDAVRAKLAALGLKPAALQKAVDWARAAPANPAAPQQKTVKAKTAPSAKSASKPATVPKSKLNGSGKRGSKMASAA
jgi:hypothetical protein